MDVTESMRCGEFVIEQAKEVIDTLGTREAGGVGERKAQEHFAALLRDFGAHSITMEPFRVHPLAFFAFERVIAVLFLLSMIFFWFGVNWAWTISHCAIFVLVVEFVFYKQLLDPFFPGYTSYNVVARFMPNNGLKPTRRLIIGGHADAAYYWRINHKPAPYVMWTFHFFQVGAAVIAMVTIYFPGHRNLVMGITHIICALLLLTIFINTDFGTVVPGANDNLTGALGTIAVARHLKTKASMQNTEIVAFVSGSEEAGLRGAKAFAETHRMELTASGMETAFIEIETLHDLKHLNIAHRDMNGLVRQDERIVKLLSDAARKELGYEIVKQVIGIGATDAAALGQIGVPSISIEGMNSSMPDLYHTIRDTVDNMNVDCIAAALRVVTRAAINFDRFGLSIEGHSMSQNAVNENEIYAVVDVEPRPETVVQISNEDTFTTLVPDHPNTSTEQ